MARRSFCIHQGWNNKEAWALERTISGRPEYVKQAAEASLKRLNREVIDFYYIHRIDAHTPIEETIGAISDLVKEGKVRYLGICEASPSTIRRAHNVHPLTAVQSEYSLFTRNIEKEVLPICNELGIGFVAYSPLSRGLLTGQMTQASIGNGDVRKVLPRMQGENFAHNLKIVAKISEIASHKGVTAPQLALAWLLSKNDHIIPIPGSGKVKHLMENKQTAEIEINSKELSEIEAIISSEKVWGDRYTKGLMLGIEKY